MSEKGVPQRSASRGPLAARLCRTDGADGRDMALHATSLRKSEIDDSILRHQPADQNRRSIAQD
jgi:hypothetical protein